MILNGKLFNRSVRIYGKGCQLGFLDRGTGTDTSQAITINAVSGVITSSTTTLAGATSQTITLTNKYISANSILLCNVKTGGTGNPVLEEVVCSAGSATITVRNVHASTALNQAYVITFLVIDLG